MISNPYKEHQASPVNIPSQSQGRVPSPGMWLIRVCLLPALFFQFVPATVLGYAPNDPYADLADLWSLAHLRGGKAGQFSSYDRTGGWYDFNHWLYIRPDSGRVLAEATGPGAITRIWMAAGSSQGGHPNGLTEDARIKIFLDNDTIPAVDTSAVCLFGRWAPFVPPLAGYSSGGDYCYVPMPFRESMRVVLYPRSTVLSFYHVDYIAFEDTAGIRPFALPLDSASQAYYDSIAYDWSHLGTDPKAYEENPASFEVTEGIPPGERRTFADLVGPGIIGSLWAKISPANGRTYENTILEARWDLEGIPAINAPFGHFFGTGLGPARFNSLLIGTSPESRYCFLPMPFRACNYSVYNADSTLTDTVTLRFTYLKGPVDSLGRLHALFRRENPTSFGIDYTLLDINDAGPGHYLGTVLAVRGNPKDIAHLEGDETIVQDGHPIRWRGTGSEDYFNCGWYFWDGGPIRPLHGAPIVNHTMSQFTMYRLHLADAIPFQNSLRVTMEHGDQNTYQANYASVAYWYAAPQSPKIFSSAAQSGPGVNGLGDAEGWVDVSPNPKRDHCTIACSPAPPGETHLKIYEISGRIVRTFTSRPSSPAPLAFTWDGRDDQGRKVSSGVYFVRLGGARPAAAAKLLLVR